MQSGRESRVESRESKSARPKPALDARASTFDWLFALVFGLFLGLAIWKFGNPVVLDQKITPPTSLAKVWTDAWPPRWSHWILAPLALVGGCLALAGKSRWPGSRWLWLLPLLWFGWQLLSATRTVDAFLTSTTLWQFGGCVACYFIGALVIGAPASGPARWSSNSGLSENMLKPEHQADSRAAPEAGAPYSRNALPVLLIGILIAFTFCLVRAAEQELYEFPQTHRMLMEGERSGWTNFPPEMLLEMKRDGTLVTTNGVDVINSAILARFAKGRVMGTLVYPNALAGVILMLLPVSLALAFNSARQLRPLVRAPLIALTFLLGGFGLFWSGSKAGWLIGVMLAGIWLFRLNWRARLKWIALTTVLLAGLAVFAVRFQHYFAAGATSVGARFDYWRAAVQTTRANPLFGTGPGTFQRPYKQIKLPDAEMSRFVHNDYLEQFSDSGIVGGVCYAAWIGLALVTVGQRAWRSSGYLQFSLFLGLLGWFVQGLTEFSLYIPALAWTAFTLLGCLLRVTGNQFDKGQATG